MPHSEDQPQTPNQRAAQQRRYEQAMALLRAEQPDYETAGAALLQCVVNEPGNSIFVEAYLACWSRRYDHNLKGSFWRGFAPTYAWRQAVAGEDFAAATQAGLVLLQSNPWWKEVLISLADIRQAMQHGEAADRYLQQATAAHPDCPQLKRRRAELAVSVGDYARACELWRDVARLSPGDEQAEAAIRSLAPVLPPEVTEQVEVWRNEFEQNPQAGDLAVQLAGVYAEHHFYDDAERIIDAAIAAGGKSLQLIAELEAVQLARLQHRAAIARSRFEDDPAPAGQQLAERLEREYQNREIEILTQRLQRDPEATAVKQQLAEKLQRAGKYAQAVALWEEIRRIDGLRTLACLNAGESLSHLRQFEQALTCFVTAIEANDGSPEQLQRALRHAANLAESTGRREMAESFRKRISS